MSCPQSSTVVELLWIIDSSPIEGDLCTVIRVGTGVLEVMDMNVYRNVLETDRPRN